MKEYKDLLKDPRWQKKRLEILERDEWKCQYCGDDENTLHVHHKRYNKSGNPWDVSSDDLITICENCHNIISAPIEFYSTNNLFDIKKFVDEICLLSARFSFSKIIFYKGDVIVKIRNVGMENFSYILWTLSKLKKFMEERGEYNLFIECNNTITNISDLINPLKTYEENGNFRIKNFDITS